MNNTNTGNLDKSIIVFLTVIIGLLSACIYYRTGYFESSISTQEIVIYQDGMKKPVTSKKYYRDLSGNWILLDKNIVITEDKWSSINQNVKR